MSNGGPAFPQVVQVGSISETKGGMHLRDWFAGQMQADDRLVKVIRAMNAHDLALFARQAEESLDSMDRVEATEKRLMLEAKAIARCRFIQADAMLEERSK